MDIVLLIIALSISTYIVSSFYYTSRNREVLPNLVVLCYLWQIIGVIVAYGFYYGSLYQMLGFPHWLNGFFVLILGISILGFCLHLKRVGISRNTLLKTVLLTGCVTVIIWAVAAHVIDIKVAIFFNIIIYTISLGAMYKNRVENQSEIFFVQMLVGIITFAVAYSLKNTFSDVYIYGITSGSIFLISLSAMLYYLEYTTGHLRRSNELLRNEREHYDRLRQKLDLALDIIHDGVWEYDLPTNTVFASQSMHRMLGFDEVHGEGPINNFFEQIHPEDRAKLSADIHGETPERLATYFKVHEGRILQRDIRVLTYPGKQYRWYRLKTSPRITESGDLKVYGALMDIQNLKDAEEHIRRLAYFDGLTGLKNRSSFVEALETLSGPSVIFVIDLDHVEQIFDSRGHQFGNEVILRISQSLSTETEGLFLLFRTNASRWSIIADFQEYEAVSAHISTVFHTPIEVRDIRIHVTASIGYSYFDPRFSTPDRLMIQLDLALREARLRGGGCEVQYLESFYEKVREDVEISESLRGAIQTEQFFLHYQPQIDLRTGAVCGYEALLRWRLNGKLIPPDRIIKIAEETGQIHRLGLLIVTMAFKDRDFVQKGQTISINLSAMQLEQVDFAEDIKQIAANYEADPKAFIFEITEGVLLRGSDETTENLEKIRELGFQIALDDFGAGYASYGYLVKLPLDELKLDRGLVQEALSTDGNADVIRNMIQLGQTLGLRVVCEGIETEEQYRTLKDFGCDIGQGYYFSRPLSKNQFCESSFTPKDALNVYPTA